MQLITKVKVMPADKHALLQIIRNFNAACNYLSEIAFREQIFHWLPLQRRAYREIRERFGLKSAAAIVAIRKVAYAYSDKARRDRLSTFAPLGAIPLYEHSYKSDNTVCFYGLRLPFKCRPGSVLSGKHQATLAYQDAKCIIHQVIETPETEPYDPQGYLGVDLGIKNIATDSNGKVYSGGHLNGLRHRHARLRAKLQAKGTRSAKRRLLKRRQKEKRFARWVNHNISKALVVEAQRHTLGIAIEDLKGIRERITVRRENRRQAHAWAFQQLRGFVEYKAKLAGVSCVTVDPRNTSRTCPACGCVDRANRPNQATFKCVSCGHAGLADHIAAINIGRRAGGDQPYAASPVSLVSSGIAASLLPRAVDNRQNKGRGTMFARIDNLRFSYDRDLSRARRLLWEAASGRLCTSPGN